MVLEVQENKEINNKINKAIKEVSNLKTNLAVCDLVIILDKIEETLEQYFNYMSNAQVKRILKALSKVSYQITKKIGYRLKKIKKNEIKKDYWYFIFRNSINKKNRLMRNYKVKTQ